MKTINLEEIIQECVGIMPGTKNTTPMDYGECKFVLKYFAEKLIELTSRNAETKNTFISTGDYGGYERVIVDKESILNTIKQII